MSPSDDEEQPEVYPMSAGELLERAAEAIEKFGWIRGSMGSELCGFCLLGALDYARWNRPAAWSCPDGVIDDAERVLRVIVGDYRLATWNDDKKRSKEEVLGLLRMAADRVRSAPTRQSEMTE